MLLLRKEKRNLNKSLCIYITLQGNLQLQGKTHNKTYHLNCFSFSKSLEVEKEPTNSGKKVKILSLFTPYKQNNQLSAIVVWKIQPRLLTSQRHKYISCFKQQYRILRQDYLQARYKHISYLEQQQRTLKQDYLPPRDINMSVVQNSNIKHSSKITYALERDIYQLSRIVVKNIQVRFTYHLEIYISALQNRSRTLRQDYLQAGDIPISCLEQQQRIFRYDLLTAQRYKHISSLEQQYRNTQVRLLTFQRDIYQLSRPVV